MGKREQEDGDARQVSPSSAADGSEDVTFPPPSGRPPLSVHDTLLRATIDVVSTVGYEATVVDAIVRASGLSRTVFYRRLGGKQAAVVAAARQILDGLALAVRTALTEHDEGRDDEGRGIAGRAPAMGRSPSAGSDRGSSDGADADRQSPDRVTVGLSALVHALAADPPAAAVLFLEAPGAGLGARALRADLLSLITTILGDPPDLAAWSPAGAVLDVLHRRIVAGRPADLAPLVPTLIETLQPFSSPTSLPHVDR